MTKSEILHGHAERLARLQQLYGDTEAMLRREYLISRAKYRRDLRRLLGEAQFTIFFTFSMKLQATSL